MQLRHGKSYRLRRIWSQELYLLCSDHAILLHGVKMAGNLSHIQLPTLMAEDGKMNKLQEDGFQT